MNGHLTFVYGTMNSGKSTFALQLDYNFRSASRTGVLFTRQDRAGTATISSRLGLSRDAVEVTDTTDLAATVTNLNPHADFVIADEVQFYNAAQIDQLGHLADAVGPRDGYAPVEVYAFGLATDFTGTLFPGAARLFEIADAHQPLPAQALCWCGQTGRFNARLIDGHMVTEGEQVAIGDTDGAALSYTVLCRRHYTQRRSSGTV